MMMVGLCKEATSLLVSANLCSSSSHF